MAPEERINKPLRRHVWTSKDRVWTPATLGRERTVFFDTRVTGHPEVWQSLHGAVQILWLPLAREPFDEGVAAAQLLLDAAEITLPTGDLAQGAYDSSGQYYQLNEWVVADPVNMGEDEATIDSVAAGLLARDLKEDLAGGEETTEELDEYENVQRREEKGKAIDNTQNRLSVSARLSENDGKVTVSFSESDSVGTISSKILSASGVSQLSATRALHIINKPPSFPLGEKYASFSWARV